MANTLLRVLYLTSLLSCCGVACPPTARAEDAEKLAFFNCGRTPVRLSWLEPGRLIFQRDDDMVALAQVAATEGLTFRTVEGEDPQFLFQVKGQWAHITYLPSSPTATAPTSEENCHRADVQTHTDVPLYRAFGHNPDWELVFGNSVLTLVADPGRQQFVFSRPHARIRPDSRIYSGDKIKVTVTNNLCTDPVSGLFYPEQVEISLYGRKLEGCGEILGADPTPAP